MIVRDEEDCLAHVLSDAAPFCDEIIIVDTGSTDRTIEIAKEFGAKVFNFTWINDFSAARNFALSQCTGEWIIWLDADDRITPEAQAAMHDIKNEIMGHEDFDVVLIPYHTEFVPENLDICRISVNRERFIRRESGLQWVGPIHETIPVPRDRSMFRSNAWIDHRPPANRPVRKANRNIELLEEAIANGDHSPRTQFFLANEMVARNRHSDAIAIFEGILAGSITEDIRYDTLCSLAISVEAIGDVERKLELLVQAIAFDSVHAKAFILLGLHHYERQAWAAAMPFFAAATVIERPSAADAGLLLEPAYSWLPWDYLAVCASQLGQYQDALRFTGETAPNNPERDRIQHNVRFYIEQLTSTMSEQQVTELIGDIAHVF